MKTEICAQVLKFAVAMNGVEIDHKDEVGEYRSSVFTEIEQTFGFQGQPPADKKYFEGEWVVSFGHSGQREGFEVASHQKFLENGVAEYRSTDGTHEVLNNCWVLNGDVSFSVWDYVAPMPEYGIDESTHSEERFHALVKDQDEFVLFNGDGSMVYHYLRKK